MQAYRVPYEPENVSAKITESPGENSKVSGWQQYFDGVYYGVILADTVVPVLWFQISEHWVSQVVLCVFSEDIQVLFIGKDKRFAGFCGIFEDIPIA